MNHQFPTFRFLKLSGLLALLSAVPLCYAESTSAVTRLSVTVEAVCIFNGLQADLVELKCTRGSPPPQDPRAMSGVPDRLRFAGPLVMVQSAQSADGAALYSYATAQVTAEGEQTLAQGDIFFF